MWARVSSDGDLTAMPSAMVATRSRRHEPARVERGAHRRRARGLDADDADAGRVPAERGGDARDEPAAADGDDHDLGLGRLLGELEADGALPGDDQRVVERRARTRAPCSSAYAVRGGERVVDRAALEARPSAP